MIRIMSDGADTTNPVMLSDEQRHIFELVKKRKNVFVTGSAGQ